MADAGAVEPVLLWLLCCLGFYFVSVRSRLHARLAGLEARNQELVDAVRQHEKLEAKLRQQSKELQRQRLAALNIAEDAKRARAEAESSNEWFERAIEAAPNGMVLVDDKGIIRLVNAELERLVGYTREELLGQPVEVIVPDRFRDGHISYRDAYLGNPVTRAMGAGRDLYAKRKGGTEFPVEIGLNPMSTAEGRFVLGAVVDISERKSAEETMRRYAATLERSNEELERFAYVASHDLKAPVNAIQRLTGWIIEDAGDSLTEETRQYLELLQGRIDRMESLLDSLLQYSRLDRVESEVSLVDVKQLLEDVVDFLAPPEGFEVVIETPMPVIPTDRPPLELVFRNIIGNAIKHHDRERGRITVRSEVSENAVEFCIADDGPGIPKDYHRQIFEMFRTLKPRDVVEGSGMGLALVKKTVERRGGRVTVESSGERGAAFKVWWPRSQLEEGDSYAARG